MVRERKRVYLRSSSSSPIDVGGLSQPRRRSDLGSYFFPFSSSGCIVVCFGFSITSLRWPSDLPLGSGGLFSTCFAGFGLREAVASLAPLSPAIPRIYSVLSIYESEAYLFTLLLDLFC